MERTTVTTTSSSANVSHGIRKRERCRVYTPDLDLIIGGLSGNNVQVGHSNQATLADKGQRRIAALLLRNAGDFVIACIVDDHLSADLDGQTVRGRKIRIANMVLRTGRGCGP
jgi:hypothetical protein